MTASRLALALRRWVDSGAEAAGPGGEAEHRVDWARVLPFVAVHAALPRRPRDRGECHRDRRRGRAVPGPHVRDHGVLSPVLFPSRLPRLARRAVRVRAAGRLGRAARARCGGRRITGITTRTRTARTTPTLPSSTGFLRSHCGWFLARENFATHLARVPDLARYPELRWLDRYDAVVPAALAALLFGIGAWLERAAPDLGVSGAQLLVWGFCISTVLLWHATFTINSLAHRFGSRRYATRDDSRNNVWLALLTLGEGWHNNHHRYPAAARQGFFWWEIDVAWYGLRLLEALGVVRDLTPVPAAIRDSHRRARDGAPR